MDITQLLLNLALTITTILVVIVGIQLVFVLKTIRETIKKVGDPKLLEKVSLHKHQEKERTKTAHDKHSPLHSIIDRVRFLSPHDTHDKKFFIKDK